MYVLKQGDLQDDIFVDLVNELRAQLGWKGRNDFTLVKHRFRHEHVIVEGTDLPAGLRIHFFRLFGAKKKARAQYVTSVSANGPYEHNVRIPGCANA